MSPRRDVPDELTYMLRWARDEGVSFGEAWPTAVSIVTEGRPDAAFWQSMLPTIRACWKRAYDLQPQAKGDHVWQILVDVFGGRRPGPPEELEERRRCARLGCPGDMTYRAPQARFCSYACQRRAAYARERTTTQRYTRSGERTLRARPKISESSREAASVRSAAVIYPAIEPEPTR